MTKQDYIRLKKADPMAVLYEFYKERFNPKRHKVMLSRREFDTFAPVYMDMERAFNNAVIHYDNLFSVTVLADKTGNIIEIY